MAIAKVTLNGSTLMDTTGVTVTEEQLGSGITALRADGVLITGTRTPDVFLAEYGVTSFSDIETAYEAKKAVDVKASSIYAVPGLHEDLGGTLIPSEPAYKEYINPSIYEFSAEYSNKNVFTCKILTDGSGAKTIGFESTTSSGFTPVDITGKIVRVSHDSSLYAHNDVQYVIRGISDDGTAYKNWSLDISGIEDGQYYITEEMLKSHCDNYTKFFIVGFYFLSTNVRNAGDIYSFTVEIADADDYAIIPLSETLDESFIFCINKGENSYTVKLDNDDSWSSEYTQPKLDKNLGTANAGKFLIVGSDGNITAVTMTAWQGGSY